GGDRFFKAAGGKMSVSQADIGQDYQGIEGAEAERAVGLLDRDRVIAFPGAHDRAEAERESRRTGKRERPVECGERGFIIASADGDDKAGSGERGRIIAAAGDRPARVMQRGDARLLLHSAPQVPRLMAKSDDG